MIADLTLDPAIAKGLEFALIGLGLVVFEAARRRWPNAGKRDLTSADGMILVALAAAAVIVVILLLK